MPDTVKSQQDKIVAHIKKLGGDVDLNDKAPGKPAIKVNFFDRPITDAEMEPLQGLTDLRWLGLSHTKVTSTGLKHIERLTNLQELYLFETAIDDTGLEHLKRMSK